jgi:hypothetical protein
VYDFPIPLTYDSWPTFLILHYLTALTVC